MRDPVRTDLPANTGRAATRWATACLLPLALVLTGAGGDGSPRPDPAARLDAAALDHFERGRAVFEQRWTVAPSAFGRWGRGPLSNGDACTDCHANAGRGTVPDVAGEPLRSGRRAPRAAGCARCAATASGLRRAAAAPRHPRPRPRRGRGLRRRGRRARSAIPTATPSNFARRSSGSANSRTDRSVTTRGARCASRPISQARAGSTRSPTTRSSRPPQHRSPTASADVRTA